VTVSSSKGSCDGPIKPLMVRLTHPKAQSTILALLIIICLGVFVYSFMVTDTFKTLDDYAAIVNNDLIKSFDNLPKALTSSYFGENSYWRPLVFVSYMIEYRFYGLNPYFYYITNIIIHLASAVVIFFLVRFFYDDRRVAFFTSLLFATHPINWEPVANIPGRAILLSAFFYFLSFCLFCYYCRSKRRLSIYLISLMSFVLSFLSKESGAMLPLLIVAYLWIYERPRAKNGFGYLVPSVPYFVLMGLYIIARQALGMVSMFHSRTWESALLGFFSFLRSLFMFLRLFVFPYDLHYDRTRTMFTHFADAELLLTLAACVILGALFIRNYKRISANVLFFLCWFFIDLFPVSQLLVAINTQPGVISTAEHFLYSAGVGIFILMIEGATWLARQNAEKGFIDGRIMKFAFLGIYLFFFLTTIRQNILASNEVAMLGQTLKYDPDNIRMVESYGFALVTAKRYAEAEAFFRKVLEFNPDHIRSRISLGKVLCDQGRCVEGMLEYDKIRDPGPLKDLLEENKKLTYALVIRQYEQMLKDQPTNAQLHYSLGIVYARTQRTQEALAAFQEAIRLKPDFKEALFNLASLYDVLGDKDQARANFEKSLTLPGEDKELNRYAQQQLEKLR